MTSAPSAGAFELLATWQKVCQVVSSSKELLQVVKSKIISQSKTPSLPPRPPLCSSLYLPAVLAGVKLQTGGTRSPPA